MVDDLKQPRHSKAKRQRSHCSPFPRCFNWKYLDQFTKKKCLNHIKGISLAFKSLFYLSEAVNRVSVRVLFVWYCIILRCMHCASDILPAVPFLCKNCVFVYFFCLNTFL